MNVMLAYITITVLAATYVKLRYIHTSNSDCLAVALWSELLLSVLYVCIGSNCPGIPEQSQIFRICPGSRTDVQFVVATRTTLLTYVLCTIALTIAIPNQPVTAYAHAESGRRKARIFPPPSPRMRVLEKFTRLSCSHKRQTAESRHSCNR